MSSTLRKEPWPGPKMWPLVVPRTMRGDALVTCHNGVGTVSLTAADMRQQTYAILVEREGLGDGEAPALLERAADHVG
jgi:hypothetical protein